MLPLELPISPMLAKGVPEVPVGDFAYEPKWDGYRCIIIRDGDTIELGSRGKKPLTRYFPELLPPAASLPERCILDAEVIERTGEPGAEHLSWDILSQRIHPAESRVKLLSGQYPAELVCFDLLALGDDDWTGRPWTERRAMLEEIFAAELHPSLHLSAVTRDPAVAKEWFERFEGAGLDGVVAKRLASTYEQGKRTMLKIKHKRTAEAVVVGYRLHKSGEGIGSLLLAMYGDDGELHRMGGIVGFPMKVRRELLEELQPLVLEEADPGLEAPASRFSSGRDQSWVPLSPELVVEVAFDQLEGSRFRHAATFLRFRPDRDPESCRIDQVDRAIAYDLAEVLAT